MDPVSDVSVGVVVVLGVLGAVAGVAAALIHREVKRQDKSAMARFQLNPDKTMQEFILMYVGAFLMVGGLIVYNYGALVEQKFYLDIARGIFSLFTVMMVVVFVDWWRRF